MCKFEDICTGSVLNNQKQKVVLISPHCFRKAPPPPPLPRTKGNFLTPDKKYDL